MGLDWTTTGPRAMASPAVCAPRLCATTAAPASLLDPVQGWPHPRVQAAS